MTPETAPRPRRGTIEARLRQDGPVAETRTSAVVLLSGGVDSAVVLALLQQSGHRLVALWVDYGQPAAEAELHASKALADHYKIKWFRANVRGLRPPSVGEFPGRNDLLVATAGTFGAGAPIALGIHSGTGYADCSPAWAHSWQAHLALQYPATGALLAPLIEASKAEVFALAADLGVPIELAYSCEAASQPCGACSSCLDRGTHRACT